MSPDELLPFIADSEHHREKECQPFLSVIPTFLCRETPKRVLAQGREEASRYGSNDYCVSAVISDGGSERRVAYVWEVKSPQSFVMEFDDHNTRLRPTKELLKAETQLFHYVLDFQNSSSFKEYFGLGNFGQVVPAGIIIGSARTLVNKGRSGRDETDLKKLYDVSMHARKTYLYDKANLTIKNWEWVHWCLTSKTVRIDAQAGAFDAR